MIEVDILIAEFIIHQKYSRETKLNDIALAKLSTAVEFTKYILPACLWQAKVIDREIAQAAGWGATDFAVKHSSELMKVDLEILDNKICVKAYEDDDVVINENHICAGDSSGIGDTCQGGKVRDNYHKICHLEYFLSFSDSGGPLQIWSGEDLR